MPVAKLTQDQRIGVFETPLGKDELVLVRLDATEGLSQLFEFRIDALSEKPDQPFEKAIGKDCKLTIKTYGREREFNGIMTDARWVGVKDRYYAYRVTLRPWFWVLTRTTDCKIFLNETVPDIIKKVFQDNGFNDFDDSKLKGSYPKREYCVQYRETDFNFVTRLMEEEGIYYFFKHQGGKHTLMMVDSKDSHEPVPGRADTPYLPNVGQFHRREEHVYEWVSERRFETGKVEYNDYDYFKPNANMLANVNGTESYTRADTEHYDYHPGRYKDPDGEGKRYAKVKLESEQAGDYRRHANGDSMSLFPGGLTTLKAHPQGSQNIKYLIVSATHTFMAEAYSTGVASSESPYYGSYELMPADRQYRAPIVTPKPKIYGIQTAKVVTKDDKSKEEIEVEELTEIYVRFHWDRDKKRSCKVRCAQVWSGKKWGGQFIPRVGQEAVVEFLEGDPDRPLVIGTVYNKEYEPPYKLPDDKTKAGFKSQSSKDKPSGYNEMHFEDKKDQEVITVHAEKDLDTTILNKETRTIGENFRTPQGSPSRETVLKNGDDNLTIQMGNRNITLPLGSHVTTAFKDITLLVGTSIVQITPASISITSPAINLNGMVSITLTAPVITLNGNVFINGTLNVAGAALINGMAPVLVPA